MKSLLTFIVFFGILQVSAQSKFGIGIISSVDMTGMIREKDFVFYGQVGYDKVGLGYQNGVRMRYQLNSKLSLQTGFSMVTHQLKTPKIFLNPRDLNDPLVPNSFISMPSLRIIQVPVLASFYVGNRLKFGTSLGLSYNYTYRLDEKGKSYFGNEERTFENKLKLRNQNQFVSALLGVGVEYSFKKFIVRAEPTASYQLFYFNNEFANKNYNLYSVGLNLSGFYFF